MKAKLNTGMLKRLHNDVFKNEDFNVGLRSIVEVANSLLSTSYTAGRLNRKLMNFLIFNSDVRCCYKLPLTLAKGQATSYHLSRPTCQTMCSCLKQAKCRLVKLFVDRPSAVAELVLFRNMNRLGLKKCNSLPPTGSLRLCTLTRAGARTHTHTHPHK